MSGFLVNRGPGRWQVRIPLGRDSKGKRLFHTRTIRGTKKDAERYLTKVQRELDTQTFVEASPQPLNDFLDTWLSTSAEPRLSTRSLADYRSLLDRHIRPPLGHRSLAQLSPRDIQSTYAQLQARGLSARTVRYAHSVLHSALDQAVKWKLIRENPAKTVDLPRFQQREMRVLTARQARAFLGAAAHDRWHALWHLLLTTGMRPGEALGLRWADVEGDKLRIRRNLVRLGNGRWETKEPKTGKGRRTIVLAKTTTSLLQQHRRLQAAERLRAGATYSDHGLVFAAANGSPLDWRLVAQRHFHRIIKAAGLPHIRPYDLRHTCATLLIAAGENVKVVSERLGHSTAAMTLDVYTHVLPDMQEAATARLERLLAI